jgi:exopolyphosphatase/guanosine-5'-triphosphate,3'-diphosphate pyrophosphatase
MTARYATLDIGTNSVLLLAAERGPDGVFRPLAERIEITRLGRGVDRTGMLAPEALDETCAAIGTFAAEARALGCAAIAATATSAARDARNGHVLVERARALGVPVEIIGGDREAQLSWSAVASEFSRNGETLAVVDIGGGSTEFIVGSGARFSFRHSFDVGSVRLTERHVRGDPPSRESLEELKKALSTALSGVPRVEPGTRVVGIAGTYTTACSIIHAVEPYDVARVHGRVIPLAELDALADKLAALTLEERRHVPGLSPKRADVIVAGAYLAAASVRALGADRVTIGDRGVRWGYLYDRFGAA